MGMAISWVSMHNKYPCMIVSTILAVSKLQFRNFHPRYDKTMFNLDFTPSVYCALIKPSNGTHHLQSFAYKKNSNITMISLVQVPGRNAFLSLPHFFQSYKLIL